MKKEILSIFACVLLFIAMAPLGTVSDITGSLEDSVRTGRELPDIVWDIQGHSLSVESISFSHDGLTVASGSDDSTAKIWLAGDGTLLHNFPGHDDGVFSVDLSRDGQFLAAGYLVSGYPPGYQMKVWNISQETVLHTFGGAYVEFSPTSEFVASGGAFRYVFLNRVSDGQEMWYTYTGTYTTDVAFSPDGLIVASAGTDNTIKLWDTQTGDLIRTLTGHTDDVNCIAFSPDGSLLASGAGGFDNPGESTIKLWRVSDGALLRTLVGHGEWVFSVNFLPDGQFLVSSGREWTGFYQIKFWRVSDGELELTYDEQALDIDYLSNGTHFTYGRADGSVVVAHSPIAPSEETTFNMSLQKEWNLVTVPLCNPWSAETLGQNIPNCTVVSMFNPSTQAFMTHVVGTGHDDFPLHDGVGYFVYTTSNSTLSTCGFPLESINVSIFPEWNLIGWYHGYNSTGKSLGKNISSCSVVSMFDARNQSFLTHVVGTPHDNFPITCGMGLFIYTSEASYWHGEG